MDSLRLRVQKSAAERLERGLHRAVLSRRAYGARGGPSALFRMPPRGRRGVSARLAFAGPADGARNGRGASFRAAERKAQADPRRADRGSARRRDDRARRARVRDQPRSIGAMELPWLWRARPAAPPGACKRADAAIDRRRALRRLRAALGLDDLAGN